MGRSCAIYLTAMSLESADKKKKRGLAIGAAAAVAITAGAYESTEHEQQSINALNASRDHAFTIEEMDLPTKIEQLIGTTAYGGRYMEAASKRMPSIAPYLRNESKGGLVHIAEMIRLARATEILMPASWSGLSP